MTSLEVLRSFVNGEICTDEDCVGCGRISIHSQEGDVESALAVVETALRLAATALHMPQDDEPDDEITVHGYAPGHPMGCPVCAALDAALRETS